ncbi:hypothetical protein CUT44_28225 [Streptomyces carminius]|uniref:Uncharacterized protein n=1 Tax=Streptomyces carminius TaxID=2665496 RepID=A0A2M8LQE5_9ACTN|nr:hypothetical protein [Streptomyces carminius]PJE94181.1 hypothetical protein CUT44_28225 [Streptomyces carminius]
MTRSKLGKVLAAAAVSTAAVALPLATASTASAETRLLPHYTESFLECQTLGNKAAQQGMLTGFNCVQEGYWVVMYPW